MNDKTIHVQSEGKSGKVKSVRVADTAQAANMFMRMPVMTLRYNTPSRIPERMRRALAFLVNEGTLTETQEFRADKSYALAYTVADLGKLAEYPKLSLATMEKIEDPLPIYGDDHATVR